MRLRRETGDFQIVVTAGETAGTYVVNSIRPGLSAEDLIGEVVSANGVLAVVTTATQLNAETVKFVVIGDDDPIMFVYNKATGEIGRHTNSASPDPND